MTKHHFTRVFICLFVVIGIAGLITERTATGQTDAIKQGFQSPPNAAKPRVWWHWMNGNITKDGIQKDLEWMQRVGIGGFQHFDASLFTPQIVDKRLIYMTPEWKDAFKFTTELADKLGLEMAIAGSPGWSESGGPWVPAKDGMKKYVWSEMRIKGGRTNVLLRLEPQDAIFVVFKDKATVASYTQPQVIEKQVAVITNPWKVTFQIGRGAPANATFNTLQSWTENADTGIKYFSGTANYRNTFSLPKVT